LLVKEVMVINRAKKLVLLSHCLLNVNAKVNGLAEYKGALTELILFLVDENYGIIQLPCPEMGYWGIKRWGQVREQMDTPVFVRHCHLIFDPVLEQIIDYHRNGYHLVAIIGVYGSPSCGVNHTCSSASWGGELDNWQTTADIMGELQIVNSPGVFMELIGEVLRKNGIQIPMLAIEEANPADSIADIKKVLKGELK
jgi:predicted secreted protein